MSEMMMIRVNSAGFNQAVETFFSSSFNFDFKRKLSFYLNYNN